MPALNTTAISDFLKRNAVVILPAIVSIVQAVDGLTFKDALPVVVGILLRQVFTSPTFEVQEKVIDAHEDGFAAGRVFSAIVKAEAPNPDPPA